MTVIANMKKGDLVPSLRVRLDAGGSALTNLGEADEVKFWIQQPDATVTSREATVEDQDGNAGWINMQWQAGDTDQVGDIGIEVEVIWPGDRPQTWPSKGSITIRINEDLDLNVD